MITKRVDSDEGDRVIIDVASKLCEEYVFIIEWFVMSCASGKYATENIKGCSSISDITENIHPSILLEVICAIAFIIHSPGIIVTILCALLIRNATDDYSLL